MPRGSKPGERRGGRKKGTPNKRTAQETQAIQAYIETQVIEAKRVDFDPVEAIQEVTRWAHKQWLDAVLAEKAEDAVLWADRVNEWGGKAAPYIRPRLSAVEAKVNVNISIYERIERGRQRLIAA